MPLVKFLPGDGTEVMREVRCISDFARNMRGVCAFCDGDPCAEASPPDAPISLYMAHDYATACPFCEGRPS